MRDDGCHRDRTRVPSVRDATLHFIRYLWFDTLIWGIAVLACVALCSEHSCVSRVVVLHWHDAFDALLRAIASPGYGVRFSGASEMGQDFNFNPFLTLVVY